MTGGRAIDILGEEQFTQLREDISIIIQYNIRIDYDAIRTTMSLYGIDMDYLEEFLTI